MKNLDRLVAGDVFNNWNSTEFTGKKMMSFVIFFLRLPLPRPRMRFTVPRNVDGHGVFNLETAGLGSVGDAVTAVSLQEYKLTLHIFMKDQLSKSLHNPGHHPNVIISSLARY